MKKAQNNNSVQDQDGNSSKPLLSSRLFKFRAWNSNSMIYSNSYFNLECFFNAIYEEGDILMQFTGMLDENGVEIYEGDIVKVGGLRELVSYIDGILCCFNRGIHGNHTKVDIDSFEDIIVTSSDYFEPYQVIGNIYQNPELL
jgi:uncharacterized phage protein (TIGR01671 family)